MCRLLFLALLSSILAVAGYAGEPGGGKTRPVPGDYEVLKTAGQFITGPIGVAAATSGEEAAFRQLVKGPDAPARCRKLLTEGTPAGQLYGLFGLSQLDRPAFQEALPRYRNSKVAVQTMSGCVGFKTTAGEITREIEKGQLK